MKCTELLLDGITPIAAYGAVRRSLSGPSFLLESSPGAGELARHSIIGVGSIGELVAIDGKVTVSTPSGTRTCAGSTVLDAARLLLRECAPAFLESKYAPFVGAYGVATFEFAGYFERLPQLKRPAQSPPDLHLIVPEHVVIFDHYTHTVTILSLGDDSSLSQRSVAADIAQTLSTARIGALQPAQGGAALTACAAPRPFTAMVDSAKAAIHAGDVFQVVLSQAWSAPVGADPFPVYRKLRSINPSPYMFYLELDGRVLLGSSPEMLCKLDGRLARLRPLAGTRARPATNDEERAVARQLRRDPKERAEHVMLVDLGRNDLGRVCEYGSVKVSELLAVERYSHVMHLVSEVRGVVRSDCDAFDLFAATFPAGTVSGAPKIRAMQIISDLESRRRGSYGGSVVRFGFDGSLDACIVLRSADVRDGIATISAGAGIVADSVPEREDAECRAKARALALAIQADGALS
ncbi:MAG TPA: anthranilate synthase component I family protein [Candidatus Acidoferrales bacterium]|nr:anthranilate synthase component I family protein [Candidatus Acidoferrales bacterium]